MAKDAVQFVQNARDVYKNTRDWIDEKRTFEVNILPDDDIYDRVSKWITKQADSKDVVVISYTDDINIFPQKTQTNLVHVDGHDIEVTIYPKMRRMLMAENSDAKMSENKEGIIFSCKSKSAKQAVVDFIREENIEMRKSRQNLIKYISDSYGGWDAYPLSRRELESVHLKEGLKDDIIEDIDDFFANKKRYEALGIPYHRGYLFYGPPGSGKTSVIRALASHYDRNLYTLSIASIKSDEDLIQQFSRIGKNSILLIEDIDIFKSAVRRDSAEGHATLAGLLNCFDGIHAPEDALIMITTNKKENLDEALIRPGRIDRQFYIEMPTQDQFERMFEYFYGFRPEDVTFDGMSSAAVIEVFKQNINSAEGAIVQLKEIGNE